MSFTTKNYRPAGGLFCARAHIKINKCISLCCFITFFCGLHKIIGLPNILTVLFLLIIPPLVAAHNKRATHFSSQCMNPSSTFPCFRGLNTGQHVCKHSVQHHSAMVTTMYTLQKLRRWREKANLASVLSSTRTVHS